MKGHVNLGIIGVGRWGTNYLRTFNELKNCSVKWICSSKESTIKEALQKINSNSRLKTTTNYKDILKDKNIDAVAIATPGSTHYKLTKEALESGKHVLVEKPLAFTSEDVKNLIKLSEKNKKTMMVGHLHLYNPGIRKLKEDIQKGLFGKINYINLDHFGNGPIRTDMGALWDFFPHSVSILLYLLEKSPKTVSAIGASYLNKGIEDVAAMEMKFPGNILALSTASWLYPLKKMDIVVVGEKLYAAYDDYAQNEKLKYCKSRPKIMQGKITIEDQGYACPQFSSEKPLAIQLKHFIDCILRNKKPMTGGFEALKVTEALEAAQKSMEKNGMPVEVN